MSGEYGFPPIVKWPGGKEKELKYILPNMPVFNRFFEPFVGGGSVFMAVKANEYFINDLSSELISLYNNIHVKDEAFFRYVRLMDVSWNKAQLFFLGNGALVDAYIKYRSGELTDNGLKTFVNCFCEDKESDVLTILAGEYSAYPCILLDEMKKNLLRKMVRMRKLEKEKGQLPEKDINDNIETAIKSAVYMNYRFLYNNAVIAEHNPALHCALFFFMRNYAYSGMFRYSNKGEFNVPYGGIAYNTKLMGKKMDYYCSQFLSERFDNTSIYNLDFEDFLTITNPGENDFIFLDPPYDSEFSTYARNTFTRMDQERLANYVINKCCAKWMMIIKNTDFIYNLYDKEGIKIKSFDKKYQVSFMNRNNKDVTHLLITNY